MKSKKYYKRKYKRKFYKRRKPFRWYKPKNLMKYGAVAYSALKGVQYLKSLVNPEYKYYDGNSSVTPDTTGAFLALTPVAQGDGGNARDGNSIKLKHMNFKFTLSINAAATDTLVRLIFFIDKHNAHTGTTDVTISGDDYSLLESATLISNKKRENNTRYVILSDRTYRLNINNKGLIASRFTHRFNMEVKWNPSNTGFVQADKNAIYCMYMSNEATNKPTLAYRWRIQWLDN